MTARRATGERRAGLQKGIRGNEGQAAWPIGVRGTFRIDAGFERLWELFS